MGAGLHPCWGSRREAQSLPLNSLRALPPGSPGSGLAEPPAAPEQQHVPIGGHAFGKQSWLGSSCSCVVSLYCFAGERMKGKKTPTKPALGVQIFIANYLFFFNPSMIWAQPTPPSAGHRLFVFYLHLWLLRCKHAASRSYHLHISEN